MKARHLTLLALLLSFPAQAAVFQVTKTADTLDGACDHDCSLREAISASNTASNSAAGLDFVVLGPGVYELTRLGPFEDASATGDLDVLGPLAIVGAGADRTILDGSGIDRVLHSTGQHTLEVHGVTVRNGWARGSTSLDDAGGGIFASSRLILVDSVVSDNRAQYGGGINAWDLTARGSTVSGNTGIQGGGMAVAAVHLSNVTLSGNLARRGGGMLLAPYAERSEIGDTTVTGNTATEAGGGLYVTLDFDCPADGSCPSLPPYVRIDRSIVAGNTAPAQPDCGDLKNEGGFNVFGVGESCLAGPTDRAGTLAAPLDPRLGPLAGNGGPTPTHALLPGSPAIDMAFAGSCPATDQRGRPRTVNGCDAGAFEISPGCLPSDEALCLQGNRFRATVRWTAQGRSDAGRAVHLTSDTGAFWFFEPDNLEMKIKVLNGCGLNDRFWVFLSGLTDVAVEVTVEDTLTSQTWEHRHAGGSPLPTLLDTDALAECPPGGGLGVAGKVVPTPMPGSVFRVTRTNDIFNPGGCDEDCSLREAVDAANERPGTQAILLPPGVYTLHRAGRGEDASIDGDLDVAEDLVILGAGADATVLDGNGTDRVLHVLPAGSLEIHGVTVRNGRAAAEKGDFGSGGGIQADGPLTVVRSLVTGNRAEWSGGGIFDRGRLTVRDSTISDNAAQSGGGIYDWRHETSDAKLRLTNVTISGNRAEYAAGAAVDHVDTEIAHLTVTGNHATRAWGGFLRNECGCVPEETGCCGSSHFVMSRSLIAGNTALDGAPDCDILDNGGGFNLFGIGAFCRHAPTDRAGTEAAPLDPRLSPLGDHGGPTPTHLPLPDSPAIDSAGEACSTGMDQRGALRPVNLCDIGAVEAAPGCLPGPTRLCLQGGRFRVTVRWTAQGTSGPGRTVPLTADTGAFWFFDRANLEMTVKVLDGCGLGGHYWVFLSGLTDVGVEVTVEDTVTGNTWTHTHAAGTPLQPRLDTEALTCVNQ